MKCSSDMVFGVHHSASHTASVKKLYFAQRKFVNNGLRHVEYFPNDVNANEMFMQTLTGKIYVNEKKTFALGSQILFPGKLSSILDTIVLTKCCGIYIDDLAKRGFCAGFTFAIGSYQKKSVVSNRKNSRNLFL